MALNDTREGRTLLRSFDGWQEGLDRLRATMAAPHKPAVAPTAAISARLPWADDETDLAPF